MAVKNDKTAPKVEDADKDVPASEQAPVVEAPYPSQADLDAIKNGTFNRETRDVKADPSKASYQTR